tara:strand:+ start:145 stop:438 length:294 start_codon:yes stop_codon:yes gene_type:complete
MGVERVDELLNEISNQGSKKKEIDMFSLMDDWFQPKSELMKHVIIIQLIACIIVSMFLLITVGDSLSSEGLLLSVVAFMMLVGGGVQFFNRMTGGRF